MGGIGLGIAICAVTGLFAVRKGYNFFLWVLAGGIIGLLILAFLPYVNEKSDIADEAERRRLASRGNGVGGAISVVGIVLALALVASG